MFKRKFKEEFDFFGYMGFIRGFFVKHGLGEIRFYPASNKELFTEAQLTHVAPNWDINNPNGFIFAWKKYKEIVRKVTFDQFSEYESKKRKVRVTVDLDKKYISLEKSIGISSEQAEESLENSFGPNLIDANRDKDIPLKKEKIRGKERVGILNKGRRNRFINNKFLGLDVGIQDEGENTFASGNKFLGSQPRIEKLEIIGRDKIEQHGDKSEANIENIKDDHFKKESWYKHWLMKYLVYPVVAILIASIILMFF